MKSRTPTSAKALAILALVLVAGCARTPIKVHSTVDANQSPLSTFSTACTDLGATPRDWQVWLLSRFLKRTQYRIVQDEGNCVLEAHAQSSASGILQDVSVDPQRLPTITWQWKAPQLIAGALVGSRTADDAPLRIVVAFDGDRDKFNIEDKAMADMAVLFSGREMPYATLMYVWDNQLPPETVLDNARSSRAKMIVVESGPERVGQWLSFKRNLVEDFRRAFGEEPGRVISVGVLTDTNSTESNVFAYYGDIVLSPGKVPASGSASQVAR